MHPRKQNITATFPNFKNTSITINTDFWKNYTDNKVPCLPSGSILIAFNTAHSSNIKGNIGSEKIYDNFIKTFNF